MKITNRVNYSDKLTIFSTSYPDKIRYTKIPFHMYYINMSFNNTCGSVCESAWHFPTTEIKGIQGINTLIIVDKILNHYLTKDEFDVVVAINCDVGGNRSFNVVECFRYLKTGEVGECFRPNQLPHIFEYLKMIEEGKNIEQVVGCYTSKLYDIGLLNIVRND